MPSVTPERFSFSGYLSLPWRTSAIRSLSSRPPRIGHTRPTLSRYHISVPVRSNRYVINVQCLRCPAFHASHVYPDLSSSPTYPLLLFDARQIRSYREFLPHSFLHRNLHLSSLTYLIRPSSTALEIYSTLIIPPPPLPSTSFIGDSSPIDSSSLLSHPPFWILLLAHFPSALAAPRFLNLSIRTRYPTWIPSSLDHL